MKRTISIILILSMIFSVFCSTDLSVLAATSPAIPKGVVAYAISTKSIYIKWNKATGAKKYYIYRSASKNGKYKKIASTTKTKYKSTNLKKNKKYYYKVKAIKGKKTSKASKIVSAKTHKTYNKKAVNEAYYKTVQKYLNRYGEPTTKIYGSFYDYTCYYVDGVNVIKFKDFNNDGIPELFICYSSNLGFEYDGDEYYCNPSYGNSGFFCDVYYYSKGKAVKAYSGHTNINGSTGMSVPEFICFAKHYNKDYLFEVPNMDGFVPISHKAMSDGNFNTIYKYEAKYSTKAETTLYYRNGKKISEKEYRKNCDFYDSKSLETIFVCDIPQSECSVLISEVNRQLDKLQNNKAV